MLEPCLPTWRAAGLCSVCNEYAGPVHILGETIHHPECCNVARGGGVEYEWTWERPPATIAGEQAQLFGSSETPD